MKMTERIKRNMHSDKPMTLISLRLPDHVIEDLKEVAPSLGFGGYQALIRAYISNGLRKHLAEREAQQAKNATVEEFSRRLLAHGVSEKAVRDAATEMQDAQNPPCQTFETTSIDNEFALWAGQSISEKRLQDGFRALFTQGLGLIELAESGRVKVSIDTEGREQELRIALSDGSVEVDPAKIHSAMEGSRGRT